MTANELEWLTNFGFAAVVAFILLVRQGPQWRRDLENLATRLSEQSTELKAEILETNKRVDQSMKEMTKAVHLLSIIVAKSTGMDYDKVRREYEGGHHD